MVDGWNFFKDPIGKVLGLERLEPGGDVFRLGTV